MTPHALLQYIRYRRHAQTRHGVHSPYAYTFVEQVLQNRYRKLPANTPEDWGLGEHYNTLIARIKKQYGYQEVIPVQTTPFDSRQPGILLLRLSPDKWVKALQQSHTSCNTDSMIVIPTIHKTATHSRAWQHLCSLPFVRMSIDLYGVGILLFRKEFKEQQHFVLRY